MSLDVLLLAADSSARRGHDRFARELGEALGAAVRVAERADPAADLLLVDVMQSEDLSDEAATRALLLEASPGDRRQVIDRTMLGALFSDGLERWRAGEAVTDDDLLGRDTVVERMTGPVRLSRRRWGYAFVVDEAQRDLPALTADYLRAWRSG